MLMFSLCVATSWQNGPTRWAVVYSVDDWIEIVAPSPLGFMTRDYSSHMRFERRMKHVMMFCWKLMRFLM